MQQYADLEIAIRKRDERNYALGLRFNSPGDDAEQRSDPDPLVEFDPASIRQFFPDEYGKKLGAAFFNAEVMKCFSEFRAAAEKLNFPLRVRLTIEPSAPELHSIHWETLRDPRDQTAPLFMGENLIVSRFLASGQDWHPIRVRPKADLKALVIVANPQKSDETTVLESIDVAAEHAAAKLTLDGIEIIPLGSGGPVALNDIAAKLREGYDILYLVCHGILEKGEPYICLEEGITTRGADLVQRIRELRERPRMVVLASCQSAGKRGVALSGLGPRLAEVGVPAVIAMQDSISMKTSNAFMQRFFKELLIDGQADRAMSIARGEVRGEDDWWMPTLFLRLRTGRIWYVPELTSSGQENFDQWAPICESVQKGACVPIVGPGLTEYAFGGPNAVAEELARNLEFPMEPHDSSDLAKVAHFVEVSYALEFTYNRVIGKMEENLKRLGERLHINDGSTDLLAQISDKLAADGDDPMNIVANLRARVYVNASSDSLLEMALSRASVDGNLKKPVSLVTPWKSERREIVSKDSEAPLTVAVKPTTATPAVYYVFGNANDEDSWVLTEDHFYDFLIQTTRYKLMPSSVGEALLSGSLLFLGFSLDDWKFRMLFRMIMRMEGRSLMEKFRHVAVQIDAGEGAFANPRQAKKYLEKLFGASKISIYWGSSADFLRELKRRLAQMPPPPPDPPKRRI